MKVIFTNTVPQVAFTGDVKNVRPGYFRNYLLPFGKAVLATPAALTAWEKKRQQLTMEREQVREQAVAAKARLETVTLTISKKVTTKGNLYSAITEKDIATALKKQGKMEIDPKSITLKEHIKAIGTFEVPIKLASNVDGIVKLEVTAVQK